MDHRRGDPRLQQPSQSHHRAVRQLVHLWPERHLLDVLELGEAVFIAQEDLLDVCECHEYCNWGLSGMLFSLPLSVG